MSTETTEALIERMLAEHEFMPCTQHTPTVSVWWAQCEGCDWKGPRRSQCHSHATDHRAHVAAAITQALADTATTHDDYDWPDHAASAIRALYDTDSGRLDNWSER